MKEFKQDLTNRLPIIKGKLIERMAERFGSDPDTKDELRTILNSKLSKASAIDIHDNLAKPRDDVRGAKFDAESGNTNVTSREMVDAMSSSLGKGDFYRHTEDVVLSSALLRGVVSSEASNAILSGSPTGPGEKGELAIIDDPELREVAEKPHAVMVEGAIESSRAEVMDGDEKYFDAAVLAIETVDGLDQGIRDELVVAALTGSGLEQAYGRINSQLNPGAMQDIAIAAASVRNIADLDKFKQVVVESVPFEKQAQAARAFDKSRDDLIRHRTKEQFALAA